MAKGQTPGAPRKRVRFGFARRKGVGRNRPSKAELDSSAGQTLVDGGRELGAKYERGDKGGSQHQSLQNAKKHGGIKQAIEKLGKLGSSEAGDAQRGDRVGGGGRG